jgi:cytochrome bd-type quinol oxidase subunit 1
LKKSFPDPVTRYRSARVVFWTASVGLLIVAALTAWSLHRGRAAYSGIALSVVLLLCLLIALRRMRIARDQATSVDLFAGPPS